jgi:hypothetical protein
MAAEAAVAPFAFPACQVDFACDTFAEEVGIVSVYDLAYELVAGNSGETVVPTLEFKIGVADAAEKEADGCESVWTGGLGSSSDFDTALFEVDCDHILSGRGSVWLIARLATWVQSHYRMEIATR